jgi:hypothetical protein
MGRFNRYLGKLEVNVDGEELELDVKLADKQKIMALQNKFKDKPDEVMQGMTTIFSEILKRSYPDSTDEELESFLTKKFEKFLVEISIAFGWGTRVDYESSFRKEGIDKGTETKQVAPAG